MPTSSSTQGNVRLAGTTLLARIAAVAAVIFILSWLPATAQTPSPEQLELGARLYAENCAVCHGPEGEGRVGATLAKDWPSIRPDLQVKNTIENGIQGSPMPAWSKENGGPLEEHEIEALVAHILSWETGGPRSYTPSASPTARPPITPPAGVSGDPNHGALLFDDNCAVCHGPDGRGRVGARLAKAWASIRPDLQVKNTIANGVPGSVMPAWSQDNGGPLSEAEIDDLVAFVISLPQSPSQAGIPTPTEEAEISALRNWGGVGVFVILLVLVVGVILVVQRRR